MAERKAGEVSRQDDLYVLSDLEQLKVIADPLRLRILESFCGEPRTTKQVAELLGEKPTRLYHHVEALERVGLIRLAHTRQNRGTMEKYFSAVAKRFRADPGLFRGAQQRGEKAPLADVVTTVMENTTAELRKVIDAGVDVSTGEEAVLSYVELRAGDDEIAAVREKLLTFLRDLEKTCCAEPEDEEARRYRLTLAYFPLDADER